MRYCILTSHPLQHSGKIVRYAVRTIAKNSIPPTLIRRDGCDAWGADLGDDFVCALFGVQSRLAVGDTADAAPRRCTSCSAARSGKRTSWRRCSNRAPQLRGLLRVIGRCSAHDPVCLDRYAVRHLHFLGSYFGFFSHTLLNGSTIYNRAEWDLALRSSVHPLIELFSIISSMSVTHRYGVSA